jgi:hypothetical protein
MWWKESYILGLQNKEKEEKKKKKEGRERGGVSIMLLSDTCYRLHKCLSL